ncbi:MAG TPA: enolase C-terminal domain-like protein [Thermoanaerobaculia bacterium]|jgi:O-succinylbenzoate synthase
MRVDVHRYTLRRRDGGVRAGALLRTAGGYADVHPWPELGDAPLDEQLALLARGETTPLTRASLHLASVDGEARARGVSLFAGLTIPESHWPGNEPPEGFDTVKIKGVQPVPEGVRIRIDFNARLTAEEFLLLAERLPKERIDFVEDPCPYDAATWRELRARTGLRLALDRFTGEADLLVHKPALSVEFPVFRGEIVVTSYMDHPVGQFGAAWVAATHDVSPRCGLMTHVLYEPDAFVERVEREGARLLPPRGTGIGFDDLLESLPWTSIG